MTNPIFLYFINSDKKSFKKNRKPQSMEVLTSIEQIYDLQDDTSLFLLKDGTVWRAYGEEETPYHWGEGDPVALLNPTSQWTDRIDIDNLVHDDYTDLQRFGKTTLKPHKIKEIVPGPGYRMLHLKNLGKFTLFFDKSNIKERNLLDKWLPSEKVILIVDPGTDWDAYPDKKGEYKLSWEFHFLNIDRDEMISPPAHYF